MLPHSSAAIGQTRSSGSWCTNQIDSSRSLLILKAVHSIIHHPLSCHGIPAPRNDRLEREWRQGATLRGVPPLDSLYVNLLRKSSTYEADRTRSVTTAGTKN